VIAFDGPQLDALRNLRSGDSITVQGRIKLSTYQKAGEWKAGVDLLADQVVTLRKSETGAKAQERTPEPTRRAPGQTTAKLIDDEIMF
jgi:single-stranded DNA-binding protein